MKIAIITPHIFNPSGIGSMCNDLTSELIKRGYEVSIFTFDMLPQYRLNKINKSAKIYIIKQTNWMQDKWYRLLALLNIFKSMMLKLHRADIIHINGYTDLTIAGFIVGKIFRKPIILHFHGTDVWYYEKSFFNFYKRIVRNVDKVICVSDCLRDKLLRDTGVKSDVMPYIVSDFFISQRGKRSNFLKEKFNTDKILLNVKGLIPIYGHELLIRSLPDVLKKYHSLKLVLTGEGPLFKELQELVATLRLEKNVVFAGFKSHESLVDFYASSDIFILASQLDARPNVILESLSCGTPVITTNNPGGVELASQYSENVTVIREDTPEALTNAIIKLLDEDRRVSKSTIEGIAGQLNKEIITQRFRNIYSELTENRN
ncbi:glycosyltransferase family 4 protein [bacterium]|nr:glycosyltransferase family 4 protein [bacterium]